MVFIFIYFIVFVWERGFRGGLFGLLVDFFVRFDRREVRVGFVVVGVGVFFRFIVYA